MPYPIDEKLVVALASSALFDLGEGGRIYRDLGVDAYRDYQRAHEATVLAPGVAFPMVSGGTPSVHVPFGVANGLARPAA